METPVRKVCCPHCGGESPWSAANKWRPFCSERCKMIDLGAWASESYRVPVQESADPLLAPDEPPPGA
ncbi:MAG: DNA gyrase inhibitor YacG [Rhodocyclaceae bacterium]